MILNKKEQYAVLIGLYISRAGRARLQDISTNLGLSLTFLEQVARKLRVGGVLKSVRGPGGGYELDGSPTIGKLLKAIGVKLVLDQPDVTKYRTSIRVEDRAFAHFADHLAYAMSGVLALKVSEVGKGLVDTEMQLLNSVSECNLES